MHYLPLMQMINRTHHLLHQHTRSFLRIRLQFNHPVKQLASFNTVEDVRLIP